MKQNEGIGRSRRGVWLGAAIALLMGLAEPSHAASEAGLALKSASKPAVSKPTAAKQAAKPRAASSKAQNNKAEPGDRIFASGFELPGETTINLGTAIPTNGSTLPAEALPAIGVQFGVPDGTAPDIKLELDGQDVTAQAQVSANAIRYTPVQPLAEGLHAVHVRVNAAQAQWAFTTATAPVIRDQVPESDIGIGSHPHIGARYSDIGSGVDAGRVQMRVDEADITARAVVTNNSIDYVPDSAVAAGSHRVWLKVPDRAGNATETQWEFYVGSPPLVSDLLPPDGALLPVGTPSISASFHGLDATIDPASAHLYINDADVTAQSTLSMTAPNDGTVSYVPADPLAAGEYSVYFEIADQRGRAGWAQWGFSIESERVRSISIQSPIAGTTLLSPSVSVMMLVRSTDDFADAVTVNDLPARYHSAMPGGAVYQLPMVLTPGLNTLTAKAVFEDGQARTATAIVTYDAPPVVTILSPHDWETFGPLVGADGKPTPGGSTDLTGAVERPITITGTLSKSVSEVTINQQQAQLGDGGTSFTFERFFLHEGTNLLSVNATDATGRVGVANVTAYVDQTAPLLTIEGPAADAVTSAAAVDVRGIVNDAVEGGLNAPEPGVTIRNAANGQSIQASVSDHSYLGRDLPLEIGANALTVTAVDAQGNARAKAIRVIRIAVGSRRLTRFSGDRQSGAVATELAQPLAIAAIDKDGLPLANVPVRFDVLRGTGSIGLAQGEVVKSDGVNPARNLVVDTDAGGHAQVWFRLGSEAAEAGDMIRAWNESISEEVLFTATAQRGVPKYVRVSGAAGSQYAATDSQPLEALVVQVMDEQYNPSIGAAVNFHIDQGDAHFNAQSAAGGRIGADGKTLTVFTDKNGQAGVRPLLGVAPGTVRIRAMAALDAEHEVGPALFQIIVLERKNGPTSFAGVVLDHTGLPLPGVRLSISRTNLSAVSDVQGKFQFDDQAPPGKIDLYIDGRSVQIERNGQTLQYPALHFETAVIQGQANQLPHPIYLPPINLAQSKLVGGDEDVSLTIPGYDGFEMIVKAHSVTFPDGSTQGPLVVTPVHGDRLPMVPPGSFASFGAVAWTIQPTGTRFDPPIEVKIPNSAGMQPGKTLAIVQWDHDLATFVPMGRGTVNEAGTQIVSDPGSGITKAGWGGGPPPIPPNCGENPPPGICPATSSRPFDQPLVAQCSECGACRKPQQPTPGNCGLTCIPRQPNEIRFTIDQPSVGATVEIPTETAAADDPLIGLLVLGLDDDDGKTWKISARRSITVGDSAIDCKVFSDPQSFTGDYTDALNQDFRFQSGGQNAELKMLTSNDAKLTIKACGLKEQERTFKTKLTNPNESTVKAYLRGIEAGTHPGTATAAHGDIAVADTLIHLACHEPGAGNRYHHYRSNGLPIIANNNDGGFGMFQLTDGGQRTCANLWDWRAQAQAGQAIYREKLNQAASMHQGEHSHPGGALLDCLGVTNQQRPPLPPLAGLQLMHESIRRYNGGRQYQWVPDQPYVDCSQGRWERYLQIVDPPEPKYVEKVCNCDSALVPEGCLVEHNAIYRANQTVFRYSDLAVGQQAELETVFTARDGNDLNVELDAGCRIKFADGGAATDPAEFSIVQDLTATTLSAGQSAAPVRIRFTATGRSRIRLAQLSCMAIKGRPEEMVMPLRVLPPSYDSRPGPAPRDAVITMSANGTAQLVLINSFDPPKYNGRVIDPNGLPLSVSLSGLSDPIDVTPIAASIPSTKANRANQQTFTLQCHNTTQLPITQTLVVTHNGIAPGPVGAVSYQVICAAAP